MPTKQAVIEDWKRAEGTFETRDFYLACFLRCTGYDLVDLRAEGRRKVLLLHAAAKCRGSVAYYCSAAYMC